MSENHQYVMKQLDKFFAYMGTKEILQIKDKKYLWKAFFICKNKFTNEKLEHIDPDFFTKTLSIDELSLLSEMHSENSLGIFADELKEVFLSNAILGAIPFQLQEGWVEFCNINNQTNKNFSIHHISKIMHYTILSILATILYYSYSTFGWIGLAGVISFVGYWLLRKIVKKIAINNEKQTVLKEIRKEIKKSKVNNKVEDKSHNLKKDIDNIIVLPSFSHILKTELEKMKNQLHIFSQIYPQKETTNNLYMKQDILKIINNHLPQLLREFNENKYDEKMLISTIETINRVIQSHLTQLLWEDQRELAVKHRYWLNKLNENNQVMEIEK